jgi:hypothetical protein
MADGTYQPREEHAFLLDAKYFRALNFVLLDQVDRAIAELKELEKTPLRPADTSIYIYQFYPSQRTTDVIDEYLPAVNLARYTREYLENEGQFQTDDMEKFIRGLVNSVPLRKEE